MPPTDIPVGDYMTLSEIAGHLGLSYDNLAQRMSRGTAMGLAPPAPAFSLGYGQPKRWSSDVTTRRDWNIWNQNYEKITRALASHPGRAAYTPERLRHLWATGVVEEWLEDFACVITELIRCHDQAARLIRIPSRDPTGRLRAIDPAMNIVTSSYVNNLRKWACAYALRLQAADKVISAWPEAEAKWAMLRRRYLTQKWSSVLLRCSRWKIDNG